MKMPGKETADSGIYDYEDNSCFTEGIENTVEEITINTTPENDFSEYLWMEHEEEFDKEVMQRLEEEALMQECLEAFMNDENNSLNTQIQLTQWGSPFDEYVARNSKLNPEAEEFVPLRDRIPPAVPTSPTSQ